MLSANIGAKSETKVPSLTPIPLVSVSRSSKKFFLLILIPFSATGTVPSTTSIISSSVPYVLALTNSCSLNKFSFSFSSPCIVRSLANFSLGLTSPLFLDCNSPILLLTSKAIEAKVLLPFLSLSLNTKLLSTTTSLSSTLATGSPSSDKVTPYELSISFSL